MSRIFLQNPAILVTRHYFEPTFKPTIRLFSASIPKWQRNLSSTTTIDDYEIDMFGKAKDVWWNENGRFKALHSFNEIRVPYIMEALLAPGESIINIKNKNVLEVGSGGGILTEAIAKLGVNASGIDATEEMITLAREHSLANKKLANKPTFHHTSVEDFAAKHSNKFDLVVTSEVVEHVNNQKLFIKSCIDLTKPGGKVIITTLNRSLPTRIWYIWIAEALDIIPRGTHQYKKLLKYKEVKSYLEQYNCEVENSKGVLFHIITNRWEFIQSKRMWFAVTAVKKQ